MVKYIYKHLYLLNYSCMKKIILFLFVSISLNNFSQNASGVKFDWELDNKNQKININSSDLDLWILNNASFEFKTNDIRIIPEERQSSYKITVLGFTPGKGLLIKIDINDDPKLIGRNRKLSLIDKDGMNIGYFMMPIGSVAPQINTYTSTGLLPISQGDRTIRIGGIGMNGIIEVNSIDGLVLVKEIEEGRDDKHINVKMQANTINAQNSTNFAFKYFDYDNTTKDLVTKTTITYTLQIRIFPSTSIELKTEENEVYIQDVISNGGVLKKKVKTFNGSAIGNDGPSISIVGDGVIANKSKILFPSNASVEGEMELFFNDSKDLKPGEIRVKMKSATNQEYSSVIKLLHDPVIKSKQNKEGNLKFITNEPNQLLFIEGDNINNLTLLPVIANNFDIGYYGGDDKIGQYVITVTNPNITPGKYYFHLKRGNFLIETFAIDLVPPRKPQDLTSLFLFKQKGVNIAPLQVPIELSIDDGDINMFIDNALVDDKKGNQSITVKIKYYDEFGNLLDERLGHTQLGDNNIILKKTGLPVPIPVYNKSDNDDVVKPWGEARVEVSHSSDFYQQDLERKQVFIQRIIFTKKNKTDVRVALTIPPALLIYGWRDNPTDGSKLEFLPINVGFGAKMYFRKEKNNYYDKSKFSLGAYMAGINFAGKAVGTTPTDGSPTTKPLINTGDLAFMVLGQFELRRDDNLVKLPIIFGPGFTLPIGGEKTSRAFFALGIGINL